MGQNQQGVHSNSAGHQFLQWQSFGVLSGAGNHGHSFCVADISNPCFSCLQLLLDKST